MPDFGPDLSWWGDRALLIYVALVALFGCWIIWKEDERMAKILTKVLMLAFLAGVLCVMRASFLAAQN